MSRGSIKASARWATCIVIGLCWVVAPGFADHDLSAPVATASAAPTGTPTATTGIRPLPTSTTPPEPRTQLSGLYDTAAAAAVEVLVDGHLSGSGAVVDPSGAVLTAAHIFRRGAGARIEARLSDGTRAPLRHVALDRGHDVALLRLPPRERAYPALTIAHESPHAGDPVYVFGAPIYRHAVLLPGMVGRANPTFEYLADIGQYVRVVHVAGPAPSGTSGGPWVDPSGQVVGVQCGLMHESGSPVGIAYMAPLEAIRALVRDERDAATPSIGVGVEELWEQPAELIRRFPPGSEGVFVARINQGGPADLAGLRVGVLITRVDGHATPLRDDFVNAIRETPAGGRRTLTVREGFDAPRTVSVHPQPLERR